MTKALGVVEFLTAQHEQIGRGNQTVDARLREEHAAKEALAELERLDIDSAEFTRKLRRTRTPRKPRSSIGSDRTRLGASPRCSIVRDRRQASARTCR